MSEKLRESLSAVVDDEADEFEMRRVLDELAKDPALKASWVRYHMIGTVLRGEYISKGVGLRDRVWQELTVENSVQTPLQAPVAPSVAGVATTAGRRGARWASLAVAAGVAFLMVIGLGDLNLNSEEPELADTGGQTVRARDAQEAVNQAIALKEEATPLDQQRTEAYIVAHSQNRGMTSSGPEAFAKMVSYQRR